jgi:hypothetical protein
MTVATARAEADRDATIVTYYPSPRVIGMALAMFAAA